MKLRNWKIKKRYVYLSAALLLLVGVGLYMYWRFEPSAHFRNADIPVLATPEEESTSPKVQDEAQTNPSPQTSAPTDNSSQQTSFNILILGTDARDHEVSRTDVIMLAHVNSDKKTINLISIPRDTQVNIAGVGYTKINHAHILGEMKNGDSHSGTLASIQAVSNLFSCSINYYIKTDFEGFEHFIDTIGGLDVHLDKPIKLTYADQTFPAGDNHLTGAEALNLVRERKSLPGGDFGRQANQAMVLKEIMHTVIKPQNITKLPSLINQVRKDILDTNLSDSDMISLAWMAKDVKEDDLQYVQLPGHSGKAMDPIVKSELYYWIPDMDEWAKSSEHLLED
ncbi:MAG TPA: LCP family protein [Paenibacillus sp.]